MFNMAKTGGLDRAHRPGAVHRASGAAARSSARPVDLGELPVYRDEPAALESAPLAMAVTSASTAPCCRPAPANALAAVEPAGPHEIGQLVEQQPDEVAALLRGWLVDRRP